MCGIIAVFPKTKASEKHRETALKMAKIIRHRGPDASGIYSDKKALLLHERLSIVDVEKGAQPLIDKDTKRVLIANGEIYTHKELKKKLVKKHSWQTKSDCEVLLYLYDEYGHDFVDMLSGIFAFVIYDPRREEYFVARDHIGIIPLYYGYDESGTMFFASEMKALDEYCDKIKEFPPGHYYSSRDDKFVRWYDKEWMQKIPEEKSDIKETITELKEQLSKTVKKQLMSDVPYGVLISGGIDSSIISAIAAKESPRKLHSFSIGLKDSPDLKYAKMVAEYIGTIHHEQIFTVQEGLDAIRDVIYHLETFDTTTIRAATPMFLMARKIKSLGIKMVLSGEGADEMFGGYLYFHMAPDKKELHKETVRKLSMLSKYDCLRANKSMAAFGVETRVPFLDKEFLDFVMAMDPKKKMCIAGRQEKFILRKAFEGVIPNEVLFRQKEQFSDGVGYGWIDYLKEYAGKRISDKQFSKAKERFPVQTPTSKEQYWYREIFEELFKSPSASALVPVGKTIACSTSTAFEWSEKFKKRDDPSGRAVEGVHRKAIKEI